MAVHEDLAVQYHQQDTDYYCGGASAQMVLAQIGAGWTVFTALHDMDRGV